jgi:hypothetical protein
MRFPRSERLALRGSPSQKLDVMPSTIIKAEHYDETQARLAVAVGIERKTPSSLSRRDSAAPMAIRLSPARRGDRYAFRDRVRGVEPGRSIPLWGSKDIDRAWRGQQQHGLKPAWRIERQSGMNKVNLD